MLAFSVRRFALPAVFCALGIGSGCGRETFDLLPTLADSLSGMSGSGSELAGDSAVIAAGGVDAAGGASASGANAGDSADSASGAGASSGGRGSRMGHGGNSGSNGGASNGGSGHSSMCTQSEPFCTPCHSDGNCGGDTPHCDSSLGCVECSSKIHCPANETCNLIHRCAKTCKSTSDCADDPNHQVCETDLEACVSCKVNDHCLIYAHGTDICYHDACVECFDNSQCVCNNGHCMH
jgi:hypothetical protein